MIPFDCIKCGKENMDINETMNHPVDCAPSQAEAKQKPTGEEDAFARLRSGEAAHHEFRAGFNAAHAEFVRVYPSQKPRKDGRVWVSDTEFKALLEADKLRATLSERDAEIERFKAALLNWQAERSILAGRIKELETTPTVGRVTYYGALGTALDDIVAPLKAENEKLKTVAFQAQEMAKEISTENRRLTAELDEATDNENRVSAERDSLRTQLETAEREALSFESSWKEAERKLVEAEKKKELYGKALTVATIWIQQRHDAAYENMEGTDGLEFRQWLELWSISGDALKRIAAALSPSGKPEGGSGGA